MFRISCLLDFSSGHLGKLYMTCPCTLLLLCRCRYLEESGCASICINSCKVPTQVNLHIVTVKQRFFASVVFACCWQIYNHRSHLLLSWHFSTDYALHTICHAFRTFSKIEDSVQHKLTVSCYPIHPYWKWMRNKKVMSSIFISHPIITWLLFFCRRSLWKTWHCRFLWRLIMTILAVSFHSECSHQILTKMKLTKLLASHNALARSLTDKTCVLILLKCRAWRALQNSWWLAFGLCMYGSPYQSDVAVDRS